MSFAEVTDADTNRLTKYPTASLRELLTLSIPLVFSTLSVSLLGLCDRYFLSRYSIEAWQACSSAASLAFFFQISLLMIALISQAYIGHFRGANKNHLIGPLVWQMIFFSLLSMIISYPLSFIAELYFKGTEIEQGATLYFRYLAAANFLFPLGGTLASFYVGRGKTRVILLVNLSTLLINYLLNKLLIFGVTGWIAPMGIKGAAIGTIVAQSSLCAILFMMFLQKKHVSKYRTDERKFNRALFWELLKTGIPRAFGRTMVVGSWILASYFVIQKGGTYLLVHTFGVTIFLILSFLNEGMGQGLLTVTSNILGAKLQRFQKPLLTSSLIFLLITTLILAIPLLLMQDFLIEIFIKKGDLSPEVVTVLKKTCFWIWVLCLLQGINRIGVSLITASRDTLFYAACTCLTWLTFCIPVFVFVSQFNGAAPLFFLLDGLNCAALGVIYIARFVQSPHRTASPIKSRTI